jgi:hypothetical protein
MLTASAGGYSSNEELIDALLTGTHMPRVSDGSHWTHYRGHRYVDSGETQLAASLHYNVASSSGSSSSSRSSRPSSSSSSQSMEAAAELLTQSTCKIGNCCRRRCCC